MTRARGGSGQGGKVRRQGVMGGTGRWPLEACRDQPEVRAVTNMLDQGDRDVVVIGGCGHVGLPLALAFADRGAKVGIYDVSESAVATVNAGRMPFAEPGADEVLHRALSAGRLEASADPAIVATRSEEHTSELQSRRDLVCRLLLEKKKKNKNIFRLCT